MLFISITRLVSESSRRRPYWENRCAQGHSCSRVINYLFPRNILFCFSYYLYDHDYIDIKYLVIFIFMIFLHFSNTFCLLSSKTNYWFFDPCLDHLAPRSLVFIMTWAQLPPDHLFSVSTIYSCHNCFLCLLVSNYWHLSSVFWVFKIQIF